MHSRTGTEMIARHSRWKLLAVERTRPGIVFTGRVLYASVRGNEVIWKHELINVTPATEILACINMRSVLWWRPHCFSFTSRGGPNKNWEQHCMALINLCQLSYKVWYLPWTGVFTWFTYFYREWYDTFQTGSDPTSFPSFTNTFAPLVPTTCKIPNNSVYTHPLKIPTWPYDQDEVRPNIKWWKMQIDRQSFVLGQGRCSVREKENMKDSSTTWQQQS